MNTKNIFLYFLSQFLLLMVLSCSSKELGPLPEDINPKKGWNVTATQVVITGKNFAAAIKENIDSSAGPEVRPDITVLLEGTPLTGVVFRNSGELIAVVPAGLPPKTYDLVVINPGGKRGALSRAFTVTDFGPLDHFAFATIPSPQAFGSPFSVTITALDSSDKTVTDYSGTAALTDTTMTITPMAATDFSSGVWRGDVSIFAMGTGITISASDGGAVGTSNPFAVTTAPLDHFAFDFIPSPQQTGYPFLVTITAFDPYNKVKTDYYGTANLTDSSLTISPPTTTGGFSAGVWFGNVVISAPMSGLTITATDAGKTGVSNPFAVITVGPLDHFTISTISSPKNAGAPFTITITAQDASNNTVPSFNGFVNITDTTGTITPAIGGYFSGGVWTGNVTICKNQNNVNIFVNDGSGHSGVSNLFNVNPGGGGGADHFSIGFIPSPQIVGISFTLTARALDSCGALVSTFNNAAQIDDLSGLISPAVGNFSNGLMTENVMISTVYSGDTISVSTGGGPTFKFGRSNPFDVEPDTLFVMSTLPADGDMNVPPNWKILAFFNQSLDPATLNAATFTLTDTSDSSAAIPITGTVSYDAPTRAAIFSPSATLHDFANFTATLSSGIRGTTGTPLGKDHSWAFTTANITDTTPLQVTRTYPQPGATDVRLNTFLSAAFNKFLDPSSVNSTTFTVSGGITGNVVYDKQSKMLILYYPSQDLVASTTYTASINGVKDLSGNACFFSWSFTTGTLYHTTGPIVTNKYPQGGKQGVPVTTVISVTFSEPIDPLTLNTNTFNVSAGGFTVQGSIVYDPSITTATFIPAYALDFNVNYTVTVRGVTDMSGNIMSSFSTWKFKTENPQILFIDSMESGKSLWSWDPPWDLITSDYHSPAHCWTDSPGGNYANGINISLTTIPVDFSGSGLTAFMLYFWHHYDIKYNYASNDFGYLEASTNGVTWTILRTYTQLVNWKNEYVDLSAYAGNPAVYLRFRLSTDSAVVGNGWFIDDIVVTGK